MIGKERFPTRSILKSGGGRRGVYRTQGSGDLKIIEFGIVGGGPILWEGAENNSKFMESWGGGMGIQNSSRVGVIKKEKKRKIVFRIWVRGY